MLNPTNSQSGHDAETRHTPRRRSGRRKLLGIIFGLTVSVVIAEVGLRVGGIAYPITSKTDPYRGTARIPGVTFQQQSEGNAFIEINDQGFRDKRRTIEKPPGTFRIAVLGDSYVDALQVAREDRFTELLERDLNTQNWLPNQRVEVLNFGVSGYGTVQELMTLRHHVWQYEPDMVILAFLTGNDLRNNSKKLQNDPGRPYFVLHEGKLEFDSSFRQSSDYVKTRFERFCYALIDKSHILQVLNRARISYAKRKTRTEARDSISAGVQDELGLDAMVYRRPDDELWRETWEVTERLLSLMHEEVTGRGADFLVVTLSSSSQVHPVAKVRQKFMDELGVNSLFYPDNRIKRCGVEGGFDVLNLAPLFEVHATKNNVYLHGFPNTEMGRGRGHWNEDGHQLAARLIASHMRNNSHKHATSQD